MLDHFLDRYGFPGLWAATLATFVLVFAYSGTVFAQDVITVPPSSTDTVIRIGPIWDGLVPYIVAGLGALITAALGWLAYLFQRVTGANLDSKAREALHSAAMTGVNLAIQQAGTQVGKLSFDTKNLVIAKAVEWVLQAAPGAIARFGMTPTQVAELVESKIPTPLVAVPPAQVGTGGKS